MLYGDALQEIVTGLKNAGIKATTDVATLQLPGALVVPGTMNFEYLDYDNYTANVEIYLLTSNKGTIHSLNDLQQLLVKFRSAFDILEAEPVSLPLQNVSGSDPVPGLLINLEATITKD